MKIVSNLEVDGNFNIGVISATISSAGNAFFQTVSGTHFGNLSGTASNSVQLLNTQPFSIVGDISASPISFNGTSAVILNSVLSATGATPGIYGTNTSVSQFQVDSKGRIISASSVSIQFPGGGAGGSVSSVGISSTTLAVGLSPVTTSGNISVNLSATGVSAGSYGSVNNIPVISLDSYGRVISASTISSVFYPASTYYSITTPQIISSSVTLTSILPGMPSFSVLTQSPGNVIYIKGSGNISWANLANTLTWTFVDGFNTLVSFGVSGNDISNSIINTLYNWEIDAKLEPQTSAGTSATVILVGTMKFYDSSTFTLINLNESATVNTTIQNSLNISVQWSNAATNNKVTVNEMTVSQASSNSGIIYTGVGVSSVGITSTTLTITGSPVTTAGYINVDLNTFGTSGTFTKVTTDIYGRVVSGATLTSGDIPALSYLPTSSTLYTYFYGLSANVQNQLLYLSANGGSGGGSVSGAYLPLSGGSVSGNIIVSRNVFSNGLAYGSLQLATTTLTLTSASPYAISVNTNNATITLPDETTILSGQQYMIVNNGSSGQVTTIKDSGGATLTTIGQFAIVYFISWLNSASTGNWGWATNSVQTASGKIATINNSIIVNGTDGITYTLPTTNATLARTDASQTFSGTQNFGIVSGTSISATNFFEGGQLLVNRYVTVSGDIMTGGLVSPFVSATNISGTHFGNISGTALQSLSANQLTNYIRTNSNGIFYATTTQETGNEAVFFTIDPITFSATKISTLTKDWTQICFRPDTGMLYALTYGDAIYSHNPFTGVTKQITTTSAGWSGITYIPNNPLLYVNEYGGYIYSLNVDSGILTQITSAVGNWNGLMYLPLTGLLYGFGWGDYVYTIDPINGTTTQLNTNSQQWFNGVYVQTKNLIYVTTTYGYIYSINPTNGITTQITTDTQRYWMGISYNPFTKLLYAFALTGSYATGYLYSINPDTGVTTQVTSTLLYWSDIKYNNNDVYSSYYSNGSKDSLVTFSLIDITSGGTYTKVNIDSKGRVVSGANLTSSDIPSLSYFPLSGGALSSPGNIFSSGTIISTSGIFNNIITQNVNILVSSASFRSFPGSPVETDGNVNSYFQVISQNQSSGTSASTDFVATSNVGTDSNFYIDFGINGSKYLQSANNWYVNGPNDGYIYTQGSNLSIGSIGNSATSGNSINFFVNSTSAQNIIVNITSSGISATNISANSQTLTSVLDSPLTINMSATGGVIHPIIALNTGMSATVGNRFNFDFGLQEATNNAANFGFCYQGNGSSNNFITFGVYGTNDLLTISANKTATFLGPVYGSSGIGYAIGSGGQIVQATNKTTGVTLNKLTGNIIMSSAALASATTVNFVLTNSFIGANDFVNINHTSAGTLGAYGFAVTPANGSATIFIRNNTNASLSEAIAIKFMVSKAAIS